MKGFVFGIITMILILGLGLLFALLGFVGMRADNPPSKLETAIAGHAMDASVARAAPKLTNPVTPDEPSLTAGARLYRDHCTLCHGDPAHPKSPLAGLPQSPCSPIQARTWLTCRRIRTFTSLQHGIRWTAMPGWKNVLTEQQLWQLVTFLSHMRDLPPTAKQVFSETAPQSQPPSASH